MNDSVTVGTIVKRKFFGSIILGFVLFGLFLGAFGFSGTVFAVPLGGVGDFYVSFDKLEGGGFTLDPRVGEGREGSDSTFVRNRMTSATIENLHIYKHLELPYLGWVQLSMKASDSTVIKGLIQDARFVDANLNFKEMQVIEGDTFDRLWTQKANSVTITNATIVTDYLFQNVVKLNDAKFSLQQIDEPRDLYDESGNRVIRNE